MDTVIITNVIDPDTGGKIAVATDLGEGYAYPLTLCCNATGKGTEYGICCRACYEEVDWGFGSGWMLSELPDDIRQPVLDAINTK